MKNEDIRLKPEERKKVIIDGAIDAFKEHGLLGLTHERVAEKCSPETAPGTVRHYFARKEDLRNVVAQNFPAAEKERKLLRSMKRG